MICYYIVVYCIILYYGILYFVIIYYVMYISYIYIYTMYYILTWTTNLKVPCFCPVGLWQFWDPQILKRRNDLGEHRYAVVFHLEKTRRRDTWKKTNKHFKCMFQNLFQTFSQENKKTTINYSLRVVPTNRHSICHLEFYLTYSRTYILTRYLIFYPTFYFAFYVASCFTCILVFYLTYLGPFVQHVIWHLTFCRRMWAPNEEIQFKKKKHMVSKGI